MRRSGCKPFKTSDDNAGCAITADLAETEDLLALELESFRAAFSDWPRETQKELTAVRKRMAAWCLVHLDCKQIRLVVQSTYKRGRETLATARSHPTADNFHEFRKQVKELTFHLRILRPLHPPTFERLYRELKTLGEHLGQANDLAFLEDRLIALHGRGTSAERIERLVRSSSTDDVRNCRSRRRGSARSSTSCAPGNLDVASRSTLKPGMRQTKQPEIIGPMRGIMLQCDLVHGANGSSLRLETGSSATSPAIGPNILRAGLALRDRTGARLCPNLPWKVTAQPAA